MKETDEREDCPCAEMTAPSSVAGSSAPIMQCMFRSLCRGLYRGKGFREEQVSTGTALDDVPHASLEIDVCRFAAVFMVFDDVSSVATNRSLQSSDVNQHSISQTRLYGGLRELEKKLR